MLPASLHFSYSELKITHAVTSVTLKSLTALKFNYDEIGYFCCYSALFNCFFNILNFANDLSARFFVAMTSVVNGASCRTCFVSFTETMNRLSTYRLTSDKSPCLTQCFF